MPKVIEEARENILRTAKRELLQKGVDGLTIRLVAQKCGIGTGTVYNYFENKETLIANVMLEDWFAALDNMKKGCREARSVRGGLRAVYDGIAAFSDYYRPVWSDGTAQEVSQTAVFRGRSKLVSQLGEVLHPLLVRFKCSEGAYLETFIAESVLSAAVEKQPFDLYCALIERVLKKGA